MMYMWYAFIDSIHNPLKIKKTHFFTFFSEKLKNCRYKNGHNFILHVFRQSRPLI